MEQTFPSYFYGPDGQSQVFDSAEDVPTGWADHPSKAKGAKADETEPPEKRLGRAELMEALRQRGVQFAPNAGGAELAALLAASEKQRVEVDSNGKALGEAKPEPKRDPEPPPPVVPFVARVEPEEPAAEPAFPGPAPFAPFDHDGDGKPGGSLPDSDLNVPEVIAGIDGDTNLDALETAEKARDKPRKGVLKAIEDERNRRAFEA